MRSVIGFDKLYKVSRDGEIFSVRKNKYLRPSTSNGYRNYTLVDNNGVKHYMTGHSIVAKTYLAKNNKNLEVNHKDGNKLNNHVDNLEWVTRSYNQHHANKMGLRDNHGENHSQNKLDNIKVLDIVRQYRKGKTIAKLAKDYSVAYATIKDIVIGKNWNTVTGIVFTGSRD